MERYANLPLSRLEPVIYSTNINASKAVTPIANTTGTPVMKTHNRRKKAVSTSQSRRFKKTNGVIIKNTETALIEKILVKPEIESVDIQYLAEKIKTRKSDLRSYAKGSLAYLHNDIEAEIKHLLSQVGECKANQLEKYIADLQHDESKKNVLDGLKQKALDLKIAALTLKCEAATKMIDAQKDVFAFLAKHESRERLAALEDNHFLMNIKIIEKQSLASVMYMREAAKLAAAVADAKTSDFKLDDATEWHNTARSYKHRADKFSDDSDTIVRANIQKAVIEHETAMLGISSLDELACRQDGRKADCERINRETIARLGTLSRATSILAVLEQDPTKKSDLRSELNGYLVTIEIRKDHGAAVVTIPE